MTKTQRHKHDTFVRIRDFGAANRGIFPESSTAGQSFARVAEAVAEIEGHLTARVIARADARKIKAATRAKVLEYMKAIAMTGRRAMKRETAEGAFRLPRGRRAEAIVATARALTSEAAKREIEFIRLGLPPTFLGDFQSLVDGLDQAITIRLNSAPQRRRAQAGIAAALARGFEHIGELDVVVPNMLREDPVRLAEWRRARQIEGLRSSRATKPTAAVSATASSIGRLDEPPRGAPATGPANPSAAPARNATTSPSDASTEVLEQAS